MIKAIKSHPLFIIISVFMFSNIFMLLNNGWYGDDWCLSSQEGIIDIFTGVGTPIMILIDTWLINLTTQPALVFHITTIFIEILGIILFYSCLSLLGLNRTQTFILTMFFALLPYNQAKITMACFMYTIGFLLFLIAVYLFISFVQKNNLITRILSLLLFFFSFLFLPSTLVLTLAFLLFMAIFCIKQDIELNLKYLKSITLRLFAWSDFVLIPFVFWIVRIIYLKPTGIYATAGYREFTLSSVILTPVNLIVTFIQNFIGLGTIVNPLVTSGPYAILFCILSLLIFIVLYKYKQGQLSVDKRFLFIGIYLFLAGAFAYTMVGLLPLFGGFNSRHQILLKFGSPFIILYLISLIQSDKAQKIIISAIISLFIVSAISYQLQYQRSWFKQLAIEKVLKQESNLTEGTNFVVIDNTTDYNEYDDGYMFYCYTGILYKVFGTQTRFAIDSKHLNDFGKNYNTQDFINHDAYHMKNCKNISTIKYLVKINKGSTLLTNKQNIKMLYQYYFDRLKFDNSIINILSLKVVPYITENK